MITIPKNKILQSKGLGDTLGDIIESFNLDLCSNYGAVRATRTKKVAYTTTAFGEGLEWAKLPIAFVVFGGKYYLLSDNYVYEGGTQPADEFNDTFIEEDIVENYSDMKVFNDKIYISTNDELWSSSDGTNFTKVVSTVLTTSPHLMEVFKNRLYVTNSNGTVVSINTSNAIVSTGTSGALDLNLDDNWSISSLKRVGNYLWITLLNISSGDGLIYQWDGSSLDATARFELPSGVVSSTVLDNTLYIMDLQGILKKYSGNSFTEVDRLFKKIPSNFYGSKSSNNNRFVHPNGMVTNDSGNILILISDEITNVGYDDTIPSGIWEYNPSIGLYHKYSPSVSDTSGTSFNDCGQKRVYRVGALLYSKPASPSLTDNGNLLFGVQYFDGSSTSVNDTTSGVFCDDIIDSTRKYGYFITSKIFGNIQEQWNKVYVLYKKLSASDSNMIVKYRTEEDTPTETIITWVDIDRFTSSVSLASYAVGDEVQVVQGTGSGQVSHIKEISGATYILEDNFPTAVIGLTSTALVSKWIKCGDVTYDNEQQFKGLTIVKKNTSPWIQFKVCMQFNGKDELNKLQIISKDNVKE